MNSLNISILSNGIEAVIKNLPEPDGFTAKFYQIFREELTPMLLKLLHKIERKGMLPNLFYETSIILIQKLNKDMNRF
jgi:hypothetical protein